jgi:predicted lipoprotein with Yx(FWY)xxD motif
LRHGLPIGAMATLALLAAGCGSGTKSISSSASAPAASALAQTPPASTGAGAPPAGGSATAVTSKPNKLGAILAAGPKRLTVYLFEGDKGSTSTCTGACAAVWPPVRTSALPAAKGSARGAELGATARQDGSRQVTYHGHPLYFYARDGDVSDAYGQGVKSFGAGWYVLAPSGRKIDTS